MLNGMSKQFFGNLTETFIGGAVDSASDSLGATLTRVNHSTIALPAQMTAIDCFMQELGPSLTWCEERLRVSAPALRR